MNTVHKMQVYKSLYNKYASNLTKEEIDKGVSILSGMVDQQQAINAFFKKYTGKDAGVETRVKLSQLLDPDSVKGIIDAENKRIQDHNAEVERNQKEINENTKKQKADDKLKYEAKVDEAYKKANDSDSRNFNWDTYRHMSVTDKAKW